jgi:aspartyl-tRNA(Asn)/glutamyl-tRNA(Gln) amidotransferase subunit B
MLWDANASSVRPARSKEGSHDYRYFPDPDLPPLLIAEARIEHIRRELPELPEARRTRYRDSFGLGEYDADVLTASKALGDYFEETVRAHRDPKTVANWIMGEVRAALNASRRELAEFPVRPADLAELLDLVAGATVSGTAAKRIFAVMSETGERPAQIAERENLVLVRDDIALREWIEQVVAEHQEEASRYARGEGKLLGVLVGFVMRKSKGRADPRRVNQLLAERLGA